MDETPETPNEAPEEAPKPKLRAVKGGKSKNPKIVHSRRRDAEGKVRYVDHDLYEKARDLYLRQGVRQVRRMARTIGVSHGTALKLINHGYPLRKMPALKDQAELYDRQMRDAETKANQQNVEEHVTGWAQARKKNVTLSQAMKALAGNLLGRVAAIAYEAARAGGPTEAQKIANMARILRDLSGVAKEQSEVEMKWLGRLAPKLDDENDPFAMLTPEQVDYIAQHGKLPPGVSPDMLVNAAARIMKDLDAGNPPPAGG